MKLLNIHIDNFGKLNDYDIDFTRNPSVFIEDNGWGKSTLATFIRVMFYGFEGENKKKNSDKERYNFKPWNKQLYGGSVCFETKGRQYELVRHWADKEKDDTGSLVDMTTHLESKDFELSNIGEQIFGIDEQSFIRTVFLGQGNISVRNDSNGIEDKISAKIGNLTEATDDVNNYMNVKALLKDRLLKLKSGNTKGEINLLSERKNELENRIRQISNVDRSMAEFERQIRDRKDEINQIREKITNLSEEYRIAGRIGEYKALRQTYDALCEEISELKRRINNVRDYFQNRIPEIEEVEKMLVYADELDAIETSIKELESLMKPATEGELPAEEEITIMFEQVRQKKECEDLYRDCLNKIENKQNIYAVEKKIEEEKWARLCEGIDTEYNNRVAEATMQNTKKRNICFGIGGVLLIAGVALSGMAGMIAVIAGIILGLAFVIIGFIVGGTKTNIEKAPYPAKPDCSDYEKELQHYRDIRDEHSKKIEEKTNKMMNFCMKYHVVFSDDTFEQELYSFKTKIEKNMEYTEQTQRRNQKMNDLKQKRDTIIGWMTELGVEPERDFEKQISVIKEKILMYARDKQAYEQKTEKADEYIEKLNAFEIDVVEVRDMETIENEKEDMEEKYTQLQKNIELLQNDLDEQRELRNQLAEDEQNLELVKDKLDEANHKYAIIKKTSDFIDRAKEQLNARYMEPIMDAFTKYYSFISMDYLDDYDIDADINVTRKEFGERRSSNCLSKGYRDLIDVSLRMALVDVMYKDEKPFIILDDPFVNLDTLKLEQAKQFLEELAKTYQVIYFTCHESRT